VLIGQVARGFAAGRAGLRHRYPAFFMQQICTPAAPAPEPSSHRAYQCAYRPAMASRKGACHADGPAEAAAYPSSSERSADGASMRTRGLRGQVEAVAARPLLRITCFPEVRRRGNLDRRRKLLRAAGAPWVRATLLRPTVTAVHKVGRALAMGPRLGHVHAMLLRDVSLHCRQRTRPVHHPSSCKPTRRLLHRTVAGAAVPSAHVAMGRAEGAVD
jgi:hypothetical protein